MKLLTSLFVCDFAKVPKSNILITNTYPVDLWINIFFISVSKLCFRLSPVNSSSDNLLLFFSKLLFNLFIIASIFDDMSFIAIATLLISVVHGSSFIIPNLPIAILFASFSIFFNGFKIYCTNVNKIIIDIINAIVA